MKRTLKNKNIKVLMISLLCSLTITGISAGAMKINNQNSDTYSKNKNYIDNKNNKNKNNKSFKEIKENLSEKATNIICCYIQLMDDQNIEKIEKEEIEKKMAIAEEEFKKYYEKNKKFIKQKIEEYSKKSKQLKQQKNENTESYKNLKLNKKYVKSIDKYSNMINSLKEHYKKLKEEMNQKIKKIDEQKEDNLKESQDIKNTIKKNNKKDKKDKKQENKTDKTNKNQEERKNQKELTQIKNTNTPNNKYNDFEENIKAIDKNYKEINHQLNEKIKEKKEERKNNSKEQLRLSKSQKIIKKNIPKIKYIRENKEKTNNKNLTLEKPEEIHKKIHEEKKIYNIKRNSFQSDHKDVIEKIQTKLEDGYHQHEKKIFEKKIFEEITKKIKSVTNSEENPKNKAEILCEILSQENQYIKKIFEEKNKNQETREYANTIHTEIFNQVIEPSLTLAQENKLPKETKLEYLKKIEKLVSNIPNPDFKEEFEKTIEEIKAKIKTQEKQKKLNNKIFKEIVEKMQSIVKNEENLQEEKSLNKIISEKENSIKEIFERKNKNKNTIRYIQNFRYYLTQIKIQPLIEKAENKTIKKEARKKILEEMREILRKYDYAYTNQYENLYKNIIESIKIIIDDIEPLEQIVKDYKKNIKERKEKLKEMQKIIYKIPNERYKEQYNNLKNEIEKELVEEELKKQQEPEKEENLQEKIKKYILTRMDTDFHPSPEKAKEEITEKINELNNYYDMIESPENQIKTNEKEKLKIDLAEKFKKFIEEISEKFENFYKIACVETFIPIIKKCLKENEKFKKYFIKLDTKKINDNITYSENKIQEIKETKNEYEKLSNKKKEEYFKKRFERYGWTKKNAIPIIKSQIFFAEEFLNYNKIGYSYEEFAKNYSLENAEFRINGLKEFCRNNSGIIYVNN